MYIVKKNVGLKFYKAFMTKTENDYRMSFTYGKDISLFEFALNLSDLTVHFDKDFNSVRIVANDLKTDIDLSVENGKLLRGIKHINNNILDINFTNKLARDMPIEAIRCAYENNKLKSIEKYIKPSNAENRFSMIKFYYDESNNPIKYAIEYHKEHINSFTDEITSHEYDVNTHKKIRINKMTVKNI